MRYAVSVLFLITSIITLILPRSASGQAQPKFRLPLYNDTSVHFYRDNNSTQAVVEPWNCDPTQSYDGHKGSDFSGGPRGEPILAAAPGWIIEKDDGNPDGCSDCQPPNGNFVRIYHGNGISTVYTHMELGTVTPKNWYSFVDCGEEIGGVGRSGQVEGVDPLHLHFETKRNVPPMSPTLGESFDPFVGQCSPTPETWWVNQGQGSPSIQCSDDPWEFSTGDCLRTSAVVNVRSGPAGSLVGQRTAGSYGTTIGGPEGELLNGTFHVWWQVRWSDGLEGWSIETLLDQISCSAILNAPANLEQLDYSGGNLSTGQITNAGTVELMGEIDGRLRLELEVRPVSQSFSGQPTHASDLQQSDGTASKCILHLADDSYHWRARTTDENGNSSQWISFGGNNETSPDFTVQANVCALCSGSSPSTLSYVQPLNSVQGAICNSPLTASLSSSPNSGSAPLAGVDLLASVGGTGSGSTTYTFYCHRQDLGTDVIPGYAAQYSAVLDSSKEAVDLCSYSLPGTYTPKVVVQRDSFAAQAQSTVTVSASQDGPPTVSTGTASGVSQASASLNLSVNPNGASTDAWFEWGTSTSVNSPPTPRRSVGSGDSAVEISETISGLSCDNIYYYRAMAENSEGTDLGSIFSFSTSSCGGGGGGSETEELLFNGGFEDGELIWVADGDFYVAIDDNPFSGSYYAFLSNPDRTWGNNLSGDLEQVVVDIPENATDLDISFWYSISTTESSGSTTQWDTMTLEIQDITGGTGTTALATLSNLDATGTGVYNFRSDDLDEYIGESIFVRFAAETDFSNPTVFRVDNVSLIAEVPVGAPPTVETNGADQITDQSARLNLTVNPNGLSTDVWFEWDDDTNLSDETQRVSVGSGTSTLNTSITLFNVNCETTYYFEAFAENSEGQDDGAQRSFTTASCPGGPPTADTDAATNVTDTSATLTAEIFPNQRETTAWFDWGDTQEMRNRRGTTSVGDGNSWVPLSTTLSTLGCETTYYFRAGAENESGSDFGATHTFTTASCPTTPPEVDTLPADGITSSSANMHAFITYYGLPTSGWFEWGAGALDKESPHVPFPEGFNTSSLDFGPTSLTCETSYQYRAVAENEHGRDYGNVLTFDTTACSSGCGVDDLTLSELTVSDVSTYTACNSIVVGPNTVVLDGGQLDLTAPLVAFGDGFVVENGGRLRVDAGGASSLFEDDFDDGEIDSQKWTYEGNTVTETGGELHLDRLVTDDGGAARTLPITIDPIKVLTVSRKVKVGYANDKFGGSVAFDWPESPDYRFAVNYSHYFYDSGQECTTDGFSITRNNANAHQCPERDEDGTARIPGVWDTWFDEKVVYDPVTGELDYFINGIQEFDYNVGPIPGDVDELVLNFSTWGWYTGHYQYMDDLVLSQP